MDLEHSFIVGLTFGLGILSIPSPKDLFFVKICTSKDSIWGIFLIAFLSDFFLIGIGFLIFSLFGSIRFVDLVVNIFALVYVFYLFKSVDAGAPDDYSEVGGIKNNNKKFFELSFINPYSWIDSLLFLGGMAVFANNSMYFIVGATFSSFIWFLVLIVVFRYSLNEKFKKVVFEKIPLLSKIILPIIFILLLIDSYRKIYM